MEKANLRRNCQKMTKTRQAKIQNPRKEGAKSSKAGREGKRLMPGIFMYLYFFTSQSPRLDTTICRQNA